MELRPNTLRRINIILFAVTVCGLVLTCLESFVVDPKVQENNLTYPSHKTQTPLLPRSFLQQQSQYDSIGPPFIALDTAKSSPKLPDLRAQILYYGKNLRPDSVKERSVVLLGIRGEPALVTAQAGESIYLSFNKNGTNRWSFSENNNPTPVHIIAECLDSEALIHLSVTNQEGTIIKDPPDLACFRVREIPLPPMTQVASGWKIGDHPVDNSYLLKQKARWFGRDRFLSLYGSDTYGPQTEKERVHFDGPEGEYAVFVKDQDTLAYINGQWSEQELGAQTLGNPLLVVKRIEERRMIFDLWDEDGRRRVTLELAKTPEQPPNVQKLDLKLLGARSKSNWIISILGKRTPVRADDWILFQENSFKIISTEEEIDDYIHGSLKGSLLVLEGVEKDSQGTFLKGHFFSVSHAEAAPTRIALQNQQEMKPPRTQDTSTQSSSPPKVPNLPFAHQLNGQKEANDEDENEPTEDDMQDEDTENHDIDYI